MPRLSTDKLQLLKKAFTEDAMSPGQAAQATGITYATAKRYYELWGDEIKRSLESRLVPELEASVERHLKKQKVTKKVSLSAQNETIVLLPISRFISVCGDHRVRVKVFHDLYAPPTP